MRYTDSLTEFLALHEICGHMVHLQQLAHCDRILETAPELLCISIHTQDAYFVEGTAQFISLYLGDDPARGLLPVQAELKKQELYMLVRHKNVVDLIEGRATLAQAVKRQLKYLPETIGAEDAYARLMQSPFYSCQILNYTTSLADFRVPLEKGRRAADRFFDALMGGFYAYTDIPTLLARLRIRR